jgi:hypothetical protein
MTFNAEGKMTVKVLAKTSDWEGSASADYTKWEPQISNKVVNLLSGLSGGTTPETAVTVTIPADFSKDDVALSFPNVTNPRITITDGLGQIYTALAGKYFKLDLRQTNWQVRDNLGNTVKGIPGISLGDGIDQRPNKDKLVEVLFPSDIGYIGPRTFPRSTNLTKIDLNGLSQLTAIGEYAFQNAHNVTEVDFTGCTALALIEQHSFSRMWNVPSIDLTPCTALEKIDTNAFIEPRSCRWIEFPESLKTLGDYQFRDAYSLEYVRFRSPVNPTWGWCQFNYHDWTHTWGGEADGLLSEDYNGLTSIHRAEGVDGEFSERTDHLFVIYHPNNLTYKRWKGGYYSEDDDGYHFIGQSVPETSPGTKGAWNENSPSSGVGGGNGGFPEEFRGLSSITVSATGLASSYNGQSVTTNVGVGSQTIAGGEVSFTIWTPTAGLQPLNENTGQAITGAYDDGTIVNARQSNDDWTIGGNTGTLGKPWISNSNTQFAVLELSVGASEMFRGGLEVISRTGNETTNFYRKVMYVYVDRPVVITRVMRQHNRQRTLATVSLSLLSGWNLVEKVYTTDAPIEPYVDAEGKVNHSIMYWISAGVYAPGGPVPTEDTSNIAPIPWVIQ